MRDGVCELNWRKRQSGGKGRVAEKAEWRKRQSGGKGRVAGKAEWREGREDERKVCQKVEKTFQLSDVSNRFLFFVPKNWTISMPVMS